MSDRRVFLKAEDVLSYEYMTELGKQVINNESIREMYDRALSEDKMYLDISSTTYADTHDVTVIVGMDKSRFSQSENGYICDFPDTVQHIVSLDNTSGKVSVPGDDLCDSDADKWDGNSVYRSYVQNKYDKDITKSAEKYSDFTPEAMREAVVGTMSGRAPSDVPYIVYSESLCRVNDNGSKNVHLNVSERVGFIADDDVLNRYNTIFTIKDNNPYDFEISESEIYDDGDSDKKFNVVALPPIAQGTRTGKLTDEITTESADSDFRVQSLILNNVTSCSGRPFSFAVLARSVNEAKLEYFGDSFDDWKRFCENDFSDPSTVRMYQDLNRIDFGRSFLHIHIPDEFVKKGTEIQTLKELHVMPRYCIPSETGRYRLTQTDLDIWDGRFEVIQLNTLRRQDGGYYSDEYRNVHFGKNNNDLCLPANHVFAGFDKDFGFTASYVLKKMRAFNNLSADTQSYIRSQLSTVMNSSASVPVEQVTAVEADRSVVLPEMQDKRTNDFGLR